MLNDAEGRSIDLLEQKRQSARFMPGFTDFRCPASTVFVMARLNSRDCVYQEGAVRRRDESFPEAHASLGELRKGLFPEVMLHKNCQRVAQALSCRNFQVVRVICVFGQFRYMSRESGLKVQQGPKLPKV